MRKFIIVLVLLINIITACASPATTNAPPTPTADRRPTTAPSTPTTSSQPSATATTSTRIATYTHIPPSRTSPPPTITHTRIPSQTSAPTADPSVALNDNGPWLVYAGSDDGWIAVNADGTGKTVLPIQGWEFTGSPNGNLLAGRTTLQGFAADDIHRHAIFLLSLPDLSLEIIPIASYPDMPSDIDSIATFDSAVWGSPVWSPNGRYLAFVGAIDGPTSDVYVYDTVTDQIHRLTDGLGQASEPEWSPNSRWIVHRELDGWGMGCHEVGVWAAAVDGSEVKWLFKPDQCTQLLGWIGYDTFVSYEEHIDAYNVRRMDITKSEMTWLYQGQIIFGAYFNDRTKDTFFNPIDSATGLTKGYQIVGPYDLTPKLFSTSTIPPIFPVWLPGMNKYFVGNESMNMPCTYGVLIENGESTCFDEYGYPIVSPDGQWFVGESDWLRLFSADGTLISEIAEGATVNKESTTTSWRPDSAGFVYYSPANKPDQKPGLNYFSLATGQSQWIGGTTESYDLIWRDDSTGAFIITDSSSKQLFYFDLASSYLTLVDHLPDSIASTWVGAR